MRTEFGVDVLGHKFPGVRSVLCVTAVVTEQLRVAPTYVKHRTPSIVNHFLRYLNTFQTLYHVIISTALVFAAINNKSKYSKTCN